jgi:hypothetical protein
VLRQHISRRSRSLLEATQVELCQTQSLLCVSLSRKLAAQCRDDDAPDPAAVVMAIDQPHSIQLETIDLTETGTAMAPHEGRESSDSSIDLPSFIADYNAQIPMFAVINNDTVECRACSRTQRLNNPFRIHRSALRPFVPAIHTTALFIRCR